MDTKNEEIATRWANIARNERHKDLAWFIQQAIDESWAEARKAGRFVSELCEQASEAPSPAWTPGNTPDIPEGSQRWYIVARQREDGKVFTFPLLYQNRYVSALSDACWEVPACAEPVTEDAEEYYWTGWTEQSCDSCDTQWCYSLADQIIAYHELPEFHPSQLNPQP